MQRRRMSDRDILRYIDGPRRNDRALRALLRWRKGQGIPRRCDNERCTFHTAALIWNDQPLPLTLHHENGVNSDNRVANLQLLCPNCDSQNTSTKGGANRGRVIKSAGGFAIRSASGGKCYVLPIESGEYSLIGRDVKLRGPLGIR
jgi:hypothetical protein